MYEEKLHKEIKRLFGAGEQSTLDEELKLEENCRMLWYRRALMQLDIYLKLCSLRLKVEPMEVAVASRRSKGRKMNSHRQQQVRRELGSDLVMNRLQLERSSSDPPKILGNNKPMVSLWRSPLTRPIFRLVLVYLVLKFALISYLLFKRDSALKSWQVELRPSANRTALCTLANEPRLEDPELRRSINTSNQWLQELGSIIKFGMGVDLLTIQFMSIFVFALYMVSLAAIHWIKPRCDHLNFIINPNSERHRIRLELDKIVAKLVANLQSQAAFSNLVNVVCRTTMNKIDTGGISRHMEATKFFKLLMTTIPLVKPANLTPKWHRSLVYLCNTLTPMMLFSQGCGMGATIVIYCMECFLRASNRIERIKCQEWHPNGVMIKDRMELERLNDPLDLEAYSFQDGSFRSKMQLGLSVEAKYLVSSPKHILFTLEFILLMGYACICFPTYECLYWWCIWDKLKWIWQVEGQLNCCVKMLNRSLNRAHQNDEHEHEEEEEEELVKCLTISYLNYRLFSSQLASFIPTAQVFIFPMVIAGVYMMLLCYFVANYMAMIMSQTVLAGVVFFTLQVNFYLATGALFLSKSQTIMKEVLSLVSKGSGSGSSNRRIIIDLWRRQLLTPNQLAVIKSVSLMGTPISFDLLTTINFYILLLWIFLARFEQHKVTH